MSRSRFTAAVAFMNVTQRRGGPRQARMCQRLRQTHRPPRRLGIADNGDGEALAAANTASEQPQRARDTLSVH